jgi:SAM-dependent methyltransferase
MSENLVRDVHDAVAASASPAEASVRPPGTTPRELQAMRRDVLGKLRLDEPGISVAEIGCGVGLLGVPVAQRAGRYVGLDFAPQAVRVANERLQAAALGDRARALCLDVLSSGEGLDELGRFDRVLMYAVLHYARDEREAALFLQRAFDLLAPGGRALIGNVPLDDLRADWRASERVPRGVPARLLAVGRWVATPGVAPVPLTRRWKARRVIEATIKRSSGSSGDLFAPARLPAGYTLTLRTGDVERWLAALDGDLTYRWQLPSPGVPLAPARADLIVLRRQPGTGAGRRDAPH